MNEELSSLGDDELNRLLEVIESLERSTFDFLQLEVGRLKITLGKGDPTWYGPGLSSRDGGTLLGVPSPISRSMAPDDAHTPESPPFVPRASAVGSSEPNSGALATAGIVRPGIPEEVTEGTLTITSPMIGIFYAQPDPGAPPYVTVGDAVEPDTTVGLVEVMKTYNAIPAGMAGTVTAVLVKNSEMVEYGQPLFRIRPAEGA